MWQSLDRKKTGFLAALILMGATCPALAQTQGHQGQKPSDYGTCLTLVDQNAEDAHAYAMEWLDFGGGLAARHCAALALIELGHVAKAAEQLEDIAQNHGGLGNSLRIEFWSQAGNARLLTKDANQAITDFNQALSMADSLGRAELISQLLIDRARAFGLLDNYETAADDLTRALDLSPSSVAGLTLRGAARRHLDQLDPALSDLDQALILSPYYAPALLERGTVHAMLGNRSAARQDWLAAAQRGAGTDIADQARRNIERMAQDDAAHSSNTPGSDSAAE